MVSYDRMLWGYRQAQRAPRSVPLLLDTHDAPQNVRRVSGQHGLHPLEEGKLGGKTTQAESASGTPRDLAQLT